MAASNLWYAAGPEADSRRTQGRPRMSRVSDFVPQGVIPAVLLPFHDDFSIDERSFRSHLRDVASVQGLSAITVNAHSTEVASCTARRAAPGDGDRGRGSRRRPADRSRRLGRRQPGSGADRAASRGRRRLGAAGVSARAVHDGSVGGDGAGAFQDHRRRHRPAADRVPISARDRTGLSGGDAGTSVRRSADHPRHQGLDDDRAAARAADPRPAGTQAADQRAVDQQRLADELAGARLQRPACPAAAA